MTDEREVVLHKLEYGVAAVLPKGFANQPYVEIQQVVNIIGQRVYLKICQDIAAQHLDRAEFDYPADWKEAVKERFAPAWLKRRWPVRYHHVMIDIEALYPKIALPDEEYFIKVNRNVGRIGDLPTCRSKESD